MREGFDQSRQRRWPARERASKKTGQCGGNQLRWRRHGRDLRQRKPNAPLGVAAQVTAGAAGNALLRRR
jgi:hypothetical protein